MLLPILKYGAPELRRVSAPVTDIDDSIRKLAEDMVETMYAAPGIGLAAPQVGVNLRLITVDLSVGRKQGQLIILANPEIVSAEGEQQEEEACLSIPDLSAPVVRPRRVLVRGLTLEGKEVEMEGEDLLARCFSHEIDHINGLFYIDRLSPLKRNLAKRKLRKYVRERK